MNAFLIGDIAVFVGKNTDIKCDFVTDFHIFSVLCFKRFCNNSLTRICGELALYKVYLKTVAVGIFAHGKNAVIADFAVGIFCPGISEPFFIEGIFNITVLSDFINFCGVDNIKCNIIIARPGFLTVNHSLSAAECHSRNNRDECRREHNSHDCNNCTHLVKPQVFKSKLVEKFHNQTSSTILPSLIVMILSACFAMSRLCVIIITVCP